MKTIETLMIIFWIIFITLIVVSVNHGWHIFWSGLAVLGIVFSGILYIGIYKENRTLKP